MARMPEKDLLQSIREMLRRSAGHDSDKFAEDRKQAYKYYFQRPRGDEVTGRSQVVSGDLSSMVEATLSQMMDAFDTDRLAEFQALDALDEDQAQLEADTVQRLVMQGANNGFLTFASATKDALLERNGVVKVWADETVKTQTRTFENVTIEVLAEMKAELEMAGIEFDIVNFSEGESVTIRTTQRNQRLRAKCVDLANFRYPEDYDGLDYNRIQEIPFCAERHVDRRSDLVKRGFPKSKVDKLPPFHVDMSEDGRAKDVRSYHDTLEGVDSSQDLVEWYECYILADRDGDGISERRRVSVAGQDQSTLLEDVPETIVPYAVGVCILNPHRLTGISLFDKLRQIQDKTTGLERALMDNVNAVTRSRLTYLDGKVNQEDLDSGRVNGDIRVRGSVEDVRMAVAPIQVPDLTTGLLQNIEHQASQRAEMGGAALDLATGNMQLNERLGSQGLDRAYSVMEQLSSFMTKLVATTLIRSTFLLAHATLRTKFTRPIRVKRHNRWQNISPQNWPVREELTVRPGMSPNERARQVAALREVLEMQVSFSERGLDDVLVDINSFYHALTDWCRAQDISNPSKYWLDPLSPESLENLEEKQLQRQQAAEKEDQFMTQAVELEQLRTAFDKYKQDTDLQFKYWEAVLKSETEEARIVGNATKELIQQQNEPVRRGSNSAETSNGNGGNAESGNNREMGESQ